MASKRGITADDIPRKKAKRTVAGGVPSYGNDSARKTKKATKPNPAEPRVFDTEERAFPRGGGSALTPLEHKQIQAQATQDVLFEQSGRKPSKHDFQDDEDEEVEQESKDAKSGSKKRKRRDPKRVEGKVEKEVPAVKAEGLSYKRLVAGSMVLGQVTAITARDIALALPNNITGYVPITQVSEQLTSRIEKLLAEDEGQKDSDSDEELEDVDLHDVVRVGQYLRACVTSTEEEAAASSGHKSRRRIELSIAPAEANTGISKVDVTPGMMLSASVASIEDHGLVMDIGLGEASASGFMPFRELGAGIDDSEVKEGAVFLCIVTGTGSNGNVIKLSANHSVVGSLQKKTILREAPTIDAFLPGTTVEVLITDTTASGVTGKIMGMLDATADLIHSGAGVSASENAKRFPTGTKAKARVICTFPLSDDKKVGVSFLDHVLALSPSPNLSLGESATPLTALPLSSIVDNAKVTKVKPGVGLFMDVGVKSILAFAHISRLADTRVDTVSEDSGPYKVESIHRARVVGYNAMDGLYIVSLEPKVLQQPFLRIEDVAVGQAVKGKVERLVLNERGIGGLLVNLAEGITGLVPEMHMSDVQLQHPERKFKEGATVSARVLSTNPEKRLIRLTLKKTLVNSAAPIWDNYSRISPGSESVGSLVNILPSGAIVQFYGTVRAFLPVSEMSDTFIQDPRQHFRLGQVITVRCLHVDPEAGKMTVSCRDPSAVTEAQRQAFHALPLGSFVSGTVSEKSSEDVTLELHESGLRATLRMEQLTDGSEQKKLSSLKRIGVGQKLPDLVVLNKREQRLVVELTNKPSLVKAARAKKLICSFEDVQEGASVDGFIRNITLQGAYVQFGGGIVGLLLKSQMEEAAQKIPDFGLRLGQSLTARVLSIDHAQQRFLLSQRGPRVATEDNKGTNTGFSGGQLNNPVDGESQTILDYSFGKLTKARIVSVKDTQLNVQLADNVQGRVDLSETFNSWEEIKDRKQPLRQFKPRQVVTVRVLGMHDARNHRFLPITHRVGRVPVFELSMKTTEVPNSESDVLTLGKIEEGSQWIAYVNNVSERCVWVNLSPNVRGRIDLMDLTDDVSLLSDLDANYPVGSAIKVRVKHVDVSLNRLDLIAAAASGAQRLTIGDVSKGMILPGRVVKTNERQVIVQLSDSISGTVGLTDFADDYSQANPSHYNKNDIVRVCVVDIDQANKRLLLSMRPSKVLSSALPVKDRQISDVSQLRINDVVRGFVKNVSDKGLFVSLGPTITAFVRISDLSDAFIKDWKASFEIDQLVTGKVIAVDESLKQVQLSLKASLLDKDYVPPVKLEDLRVGQVVTGKVRKVEDFGVFVLVDNSNNISGLCHRSEIADGRVEDIKNVYSEGDKVKAKVLKIELDKRRVNFGLKASYFVDEDDVSEISSDDGDVDVGIDSATDGSDEDMVDGGVGIPTVGGNEEDEDMDDDDKPETEPATNGNDRALKGLSAGGFDWTGNSLHAVAASENSDSDSDEEVEMPKKKRRKAEVKVDKTGDLDKFGPQSVADYERQLLGQPNSSSLWIQYMAFQLQLNEVEHARQIAERALKTIHIREEDEKLNMWVALLNLENTYGSDSTLEEAFTRACRYLDTQEIHQRLASIYIDSGKLDKADGLFQSMMKNKTITANPSFWLNYASFLMTTLSTAARARALLPRALQSVPSFHHRQLTSRFGALEFQSPNGDSERGRTIFEGLLDSFPKRGDLWDMFVDLEKGHGNVENARALYQRMSALKMKKRRAAFVFGRWKEYEQAHGTAKDVERVRAMAEEYEREREKRAGEE